MKWRRDGSKAGSVLWGGLPILLILGLILGWMTGVSWSDNSICFGCHQDESLKKQDARGKSVSLFVSEPGFKNSIHGKLSCWDCHTHIKDDKHAEGGRKAADKRVNCVTCHEKAEKEYLQGLHSKMIMKGTERAANCYDCHGKHNIFPSKNSKSMTNVSNIDRTCNRCHSDVEFVKQHALGTALPKEEFKKSVMQRVRDGSTYADYLPGLSKGERWFYYIEAEDTTNNILNIPERVKEGERQINFYVTFEGTANRLLFISHIVLAITAVFLWIHSVFYAVNYLTTKEMHNIRLAFYSVLYGTISFFIFAFPVGGYIAHQVFGQAWSGIPFGWDITDNKSLVTFLYYAILIYLMKGEFYGLEVGKGNVISDNNFSYLVILGIILIIMGVPYFLFPDSLPPLPNLESVG